MYHSEIQNYVSSYLEIAFFPKFCLVKLEVFRRCAIYSGLDHPMYVENLIPLLVVQYFENHDEVQYLPMSFSELICLILSGGGSSYVFMEGSRLGHSLRSIYLSLTHLVSVNSYVSKSF